MVRFPADLLTATFVRRDNRFRTTVRLRDGREVAARVANSGRMGEMFVAGFPAYISPAAPGALRKTGFDLRLIGFHNTLVSVDATLPNPLFADALARGALARFAGYTGCRPEVVRGASRLDFLLTAPDQSQCWVEIKSVTLVEDGVALFPDAPTARGRKHLEELSAVVAAGERAAVVFVVQRCDAVALTPHATADPEFALALRRACAAGVQVMAHRCEVTLQGVAIADEIPVVLD